MEFPSYTDTVDRHPLTGLSIQIINGLESWFRPRFVDHRPPIFKVKVLN